MGYVSWCGDVVGWDVGSHVFYQLLLVFFDGCVGVVKRVGDVGVAFGVDGFWVERINGYVVGSEFLS